MPFVNLAWPLQIQAGKFGLFLGCMACIMHLPKASLRHWSLTLFHKSNVEPHMWYSMLLWGSQPCPLLYWQGYYGKG
jgi:hypothetical protein